MGGIIFAFLFLFLAIDSFRDGRVGWVDGMEDAARKRYRKYLGFGYLWLALVAAVGAVTELMLKINRIWVKSGIILLCYILAYAVPLLYIRWVVKHFRKDSSKTE